MSRDKRTLYVGNLPSEADDEVLYELFMQAGPVQRVNIPKEKSGSQKNFAFVEFKHEESVPYAIALMNGVELYDRTLRLQFRNNEEQSRNKYMEKLEEYRRGLRRHHQRSASNDDGANYQRQRALMAEQYQYQNQMQRNMFPQNSPIMWQMQQQSSMQMFQRYQGGTMFNNYSQHVSRYHQSYQGYDRRY